jgi:hypothetical protein
MNKLTCILWISFIQLFALGLWAQSNRATLTGTITDSTGAVVSGVQIDATNADTGVVTKAQSNDVGIYSVLNLPPGKYSVRFAKTGFRSVEYPQVTLIVAQVAQMNVTLSVGILSESVMVTTEAPVVDRETSAIGTDMKGDVVVDLPLNVYGGRHIETFAVKITPGYSPLSDPYLSVINGSQGFTKDFTVDGTSATAQIQGDSMEVGPAMEAVEEVHAITTGIDAKNGTTNGGVMMFNLKSGTSQFHGSAMLIGHNELLDANIWDNGHLMSSCQAATPGSPDCGQYRKPKARFWDYAFSAGGPIIKNKTFFFAAFERYQQSDFTLGSFVNNGATVPTAAFLNGDFGALLDTSTVLGTDVHGNPIYKGAIFNPSDPGAVFPANKMDPTQFSTLSKQLIGIYQKSYSPESSATYNNDRLPASNSPSQTPNQIVVKIDHNLRDADRLSGSWIYNHRPRTLVDSNGVWSPGSTDGGPLANARFQMVKGNEFRVSESHIFSPTVLNVFNATYNWYWNGSVPTISTNWPNELGLGDTGATNFPRIEYGDAVNGIKETDIGNTWQGFYIGDTLLLGNQMTWSKGHHTFNFGGDFRAMQINSHAGSGALTFQFSPNDTGAPTTAYANEVGFGFASMLLGKVQSASASTPFNLYGRRKAMSLYAQDDYKITSRLTLNAGLRWDVNFRFHEKYGNWANFNLNAIDPTLQIPGMIEYARNGSDSFERQQSWNNFGPQFGFAYNPWSKVVFRGSYGLLYVPIGTQYWNGVPYGFAPQIRGTNQVTQPFNWDGGYPGVYMPGTKLDTVTAAGLFPVTSIDPRSLEVGYTHNFNFGVQYELTKNTRVEVGYIGNRGHRLQDGALFYNEPTPTTFFNLVNSGHLWDYVYDPASATAAGVPYPYPGFSAWSWAAIAPYPQVAAATSTAWYYPSLYVVNPPLGQSYYDSFVIRAMKRMSHGLAMDLSYTLSQQKGNTFSNFGESWDIGGIQDYGNLGEAAHTLSPYDQKHVIKGYVSYDLPFGHGHSWLGSSGGFVDALVGGWNISSIVLYASGKPLSFYSSNYYGWANWAGTYVNYDLTGYHGSQFNRGSYVPPDSANPNPAGNRYFPVTVAADPTYGQLGNGPARIGELRGFGMTNEDISLSKRFIFGPSERFRLAFRADFYNIFNRHQFTDPVTTTNSEAFGLVQGISSDPRKGQFGVRFEW